MPVRQKTFRIEKMVPGGAKPSAPPNALAPGLQQQEILDELKALRELIAQQTPAAALRIGSGADSITLDDLSKLKNETDSIHRAVRHTMQELASLHFGAFGNAHGYASRELDAVVDSSERATQQILAAAEAIDEAANTLSASLKHEQEQALAGDIRDQVVRIFEACNFQDLGGQRIAKVLATLTFVEDRVSCMLEIWGGREALKDYAAATIGEPREPQPPLSGPKLDGESGHVSQQEIDAMFA
jgi:chemotaxis protein CheZ